MSEDAQSVTLEEEQLEQLMKTLRYQSCYCEENVWWLTQHAQLAGFERWALFVSNERKQCALWNQRAAGELGFVVWDYHVVLVTKADDHTRVWDVDCTLGMPLPLEAYLDATFPELSEEDAWLRPSFRLVPHAELMRLFSSDRRHMRTEDGYHHPPPTWPAPKAVEAPSEHSLDRFIELSDDIAGERLSMAELRARFASLPK